MIYQIQETKGAALAFQIALIDDAREEADDEPMELVCSLWRHPTGLSPGQLELMDWDTCDDLRWSECTERRRGTPAIIRWHDRDFTGKEIDVFGWAKKDPDTQAVTITMAPVFKHNLVSYPAPSMDDVRFPTGVSPGKDERVKQIVLLRSYHQKNHDGFLHRLFHSRSLGNQVVKGMVTPYTFRYTWPRTPRRSPRRTPNAAAKKRKTAPSASAAAAKSIRRRLDDTDFQQQLLLLQQQPLPLLESATRTSSPGEPPLDPPVQEAITELGINADQVAKLRRLNLNRHALWKYVGEPDLVKEDIQVPVARALLIRLKTSSPPASPAVQDMPMPETLVPEGLVFNI